MRCSEYSAGYGYMKEWTANFKFSMYAGSSKRKLLSQGLAFSSWLYDVTKASLIQRIPFLSRAPKREDFSSCVDWVGP
jgi:hypothetical protein